MLEGQSIEEVLGVLGCGKRMVPLFLMLAVANMVQVQLITTSLLSITLPFRCHSSASPYLDDVAYLVPDSQAGDSTVAVLVPIAGTDAGSRQDFFNSECLAPDSPASGQPHADNSSSASSPSPSQVPPWLHSTGMASCPYIEYDHSQYIATVVSQFHLVCERATLRPLFHIMATVGTMLGGAFAAPLSDCLGRLKGLRLGAVLGIPVHVALAFVPWYPAVLLLRAAATICCRTIIFSAISLAMESVSSRHRTAVGILMGAPYSLLVMLLAIVGHFLREWRFLHLVSGIATYLILPLSFVVEESPRWLAQSGQGHKAAQQLLRAADYDKVALPPHLVATLDKVQVFPEKDAPGEVNNNHQGSTTNFLRQFRDFPSSFCVLLATAALWFFLALMYYSVMLNSSYFSSTSAEMYVGLAGGLEAVAMLVVMPVTQRLGRRLVMGVGPPLCGSLLVANLFVPEDLVWLRWLAVMGAMFLICAAYQVLYLYITEVFPTVIRSRGLGFSCFVGILGSTAAPLVIDLLVQVVWWGSGMVLGVTGAVIALIVYFLPETNNTTLPDTLQDLENLRNGKKPPLTPPPPPLPYSVHVV